MEAFESSITFCHILSQLFQTITNMEAFWMCYCFLQGLFTVWEMKQLIVSHENIPKFCLCRLFCVWLPCDVVSAQFQLATHLCVNFIPNLEGNGIMWPSLCAGWCWATLASSTAFIFESTLIRILTTSKLAMLSTILDTSKVIPPHPLGLFVHRPTTVILRPMSFVQLF